MVPVGSSVMLELVLAVHSYHVIAYPVYIHSLPGLKLVKRFSLANETWCAVTVPPFDFVKGDCVVGNNVLGKKGYKRSTEYKIL